MSDTIAAVKEHTLEDKAILLWKEGFIQLLPDLNDLDAKNVERRWLQRYQDDSSYTIKDKALILWKDGTIRLPTDFKNVDPALVESRWNVRENVPQIGAKLAKERSRKTEETSEEETA